MLYHFLPFCPKLIPAAPLAISPSLSCPFSTAKLHEVMPDFDFLSESDLACDVVCLVYDTNNPQSFEYCAKVYKVRSRNVRKYPL